MLRFAVFGLLVFTTTLHAQTDPLDLARGLRDIGQPDLALEYLADLAKKNPPADVKTVLPLERAKTLLALAQMESEESAREGGVAQAKAEFEAFLKGNSKHPRAVEAQLSLAQVTAVQAVGQLNARRKIREANPEATAKKRAEAAMAARPLFQKASDLFGLAAKGIDAQLKDNTVSAHRKAELQKTSLQAELDRAINQYRLVDTYPMNVQGQDVKDRAAELDKARKLFTDLGKKDETSPVCWQARAWAGMCEYDKSDRAAAEKIFKQVKLDGAKSPAGVDGIRMVEFFEAYIKYDEAMAESTRQNVSMARALAKTWLDKDRYRPRMTPQRLSMTMYYALLTEKLGMAEVTYEPLSKADEAAKKTPKMRPLSASGTQYLKDAAREFKRLTEYDNEYTDLAAEHRNRAVRVIVGDTPREAKFYGDLEECQMAGLLQLRIASDAKAEAEEAALAAEVDDSLKAKAEAAKKKEAVEFAKAFALMDRAKQLLTPATPPREIAETHFNCAIAYYTAGQYPLAAVTGEAMGRQGRGSIAAKAGSIGVDSYLMAREKLTEEADDADRQADRDRAVSLGLYLDKTFPLDPSTDAVRLRIGQVFTHDKQYQEAFDILGRINASFARVDAARSLQGRAAYFLITAKDSPLTPEQKAAVFRKAVADCEAMPEPAGGAALISYFTVRTLLANLHLANPPQGYADAEAVAANAMTRVAASKLTDAEKKPLLFAAEEARLRGIYGQAYKLFEDGKYPEMAAKMLPLIGEMAKTGPAGVAGLDGETAKAAANLDAFRREYVVLAMQGRIRESEFDKATELFELLDKLGGSVDATSAALARLVALVRPQVDALRKAKKSDEADKLSASIGTLLMKQSEKPKLPVRVVATLGRSLRDLGQYEQAIDILKKVPMPAPEKFAAETLEEADRDAMIAYQVAQIELARAYRLSKKFAEADAVLKAALGDEKKKGWAKSLEFKKEAVYLLEDKAANAPAEPKDARARAWGEAKTGWEKIATQYAAIVRNRELPPNEREKLIPVYLELLADLRRCIARGNSQLLADNPTKLAESMGRLAQQIHEIETANAKSLTAEVKAKYHSLLSDYPAVFEEYKKRGGKAFLEKPDN